MALAGNKCDMPLDQQRISSQVSLDFARKHLDPSQIDVDDASPYFATDVHG